MFLSRYLKMTGNVANEAALTFTVPALEEDSVFKFCKIAPSRLDLKPISTPNSPIVPLSTSMKCEWFISNGAFVELLTSTVYCAGKQPLPLCNNK